MALLDIFKGMSNAAEAINENFNNAAITEKGSNADGHYIVFGDEYVLAFGSKEFIRSNGWRVGDDQSYDNNNIPSAFKRSMSLLFSDYNAELYDGQAAFQDIQVRTSKINSRSGSAEVIKLNGNVSAATRLTIRYLHIGRIN